MKLADIPLAPLDELYLRQSLGSFQEMERSGQITDGQVVVAVNTLEGPPFRATTRGAEEFVNFMVFVGKIRRENEDLREQSAQQQRKWCEMAEAFVDAFGEERTPPDIAEELRAVKAHLGL